METILGWLGVVNLGLVFAVALLHKLHRDKVAAELDSLRKQLPGAQ